MGAAASAIFGAAKHIVAAGLQRQLPAITQGKTACRVYAMRFLHRKCRSIIPPLADPLATRRKCYS